MTKFKPQYRRLLHIDREIRAGNYPNCTTLAAEWETSIRTIMRDLEYMKDQLDAPIEYDPLEKGFYYSKKSWFLPSVLVSEGEILSILIGRQAMSMYRGTPVAKELQRLHRKVEELLPEKIDFSPEFIEARFSFCNAPSRPLDPAVWMAVLRSLLHQFELEITYKSPASDKPKAHTIHPYHVMNIEGEWYLLGHNERHEGISQFALSRIKCARVTRRRFEVPDSFNAGEVLKNRFGRYLHHKKDGKLVTVKLLFVPELATYISEKEWHPDQKLIKRKGGALELHLPVADTLDVESWILSLGEHVKVLAPDGLRKTIANRHRKAARK